MTGVCGCPVAAALPDVKIPVCAVDFKQTQKVIFQRLKSASGVVNKIADPTVKASWTALLSAADGTKAVVSPYISGPTTEPGGAKSFGGGNATVGGVEIVIGKDPTSFTCNLFSMPQDTIAALKQMSCEELGVYLINQHGQIGCIKKETGTPGTFEYMPIPIRSLFISDLKLGGLEEPDANTMSWSFEPNWSDKFAIVTPTDFNAVTDLAKTV